MKRSFRSRARSALALGVLALAAGCTAVVVEEPPRPGPRPPHPHPQACPRIYAPVCATRGRFHKVFPNSCEARAAGWRPAPPQACPGFGGPMHPVQPMPHGPGPRRLY